MTEAQRAKFFEIRRLLDELAGGIQPADEAAFKKSIDSDRFTLMGLGAAIAVIGALLFGLGLGQRRKRLDALENAAPADSTADNAAADENA